jgi:hypothetical protein
MKIAKEKSETKKRKRELEFVPPTENDDVKDYEDQHRVKKGKRQQQQQSSVEEEETAEPTTDSKKKSSRKRKSEEL